MYKFQTNFEGVQSAAKSQEYSADIKSRDYTAAQTNLEDEA